MDLSKTRRSLIWKVKKLPLLNTLKITKKTGIQVFDKDTSPIYKLYNLKPPHLRHLHFTAAAMLGVLGGEEPTSANIEKVLCSVGIDADYWRMYRVTQADEGQLVECRIQIFRYLQTRVFVWLYENVNVNVNDRLSVLMST